MIITPILNRKDNFSYHISSENPDLGVLIDCGTPQVTDKIKELGLPVSHLLITHHHYDHVDGIDYFLESFPDVDLYTPPITNQFTKEATIVTEADKITVGDQIFRVLATPYHTRTSVCYQLEKHLFVADSLFVCSCGRMFEGRPKELHRAMQRFMAMADDTLLHVGHDYAAVNIAFARSVEPTNPDLDLLEKKVAEITTKIGFYCTTTLGQEKKTNPFLRIETPELSKFLDPQAELNQIEKIGKLRELRDRF